MSTALQNALTAIDAALPEYPSDSQLLVAAKCRGLLRGYDARWRDAGYVSVDVERMLIGDLLNVRQEKMRPSRSFKLAGKLDLIAEMDGRRYLFDHKTTSSPIDNPDYPYWRQLIVEGQATHYHLLMWLNGMKADGCIWDVARKPTISPKKISKAEIASVVGEGRYFGTVSREDREELAQGSDRESLSMYENRLAHDCTVERPQWYFQRRPIPRTDHELISFAGRLWTEAQRILADRKLTYEERPRHSGACMLYGSPCKFLGICSGYDTPEGEKWQRKESVHNELPIEGDGRNLLTNSRIRCFQVCPQKHHFEYELGIERIDEEERETLFFGSLYHAGLNAWWSTLSESNNVNCNGESETSAVSNHSSDRQATFAS